MSNLCIAEGSKSYPHYPHMKYEYSQRHVYTNCNYKCSLTFNYHTV